MAVPGAMSREELEQFVVTIVERYNTSEQLKARVAALVSPEISSITQKADETLARVKEEFLKVQNLTDSLDEKIANSARNSSECDRQELISMR